MHGLLSLNNKNPDFFWFSASPLVLFLGESCATTFLTFNDSAQQCRWVVNALMISQMEIHLGGKIRTVVLHFMKSLTTES